MKGPLRRNDPYDQGVLEKILPCERLIDVGPGIRPFDGFEAATHLCIEPHWEYVEVLGKRSYPIIQDVACNVLSLLTNFEIILFLDVIEHMEKKEGVFCIEMAKKFATRQVVVFTPLGFMEQKTGYEGLDSWGYHGGIWQTHKSGWAPDEFQGWDIYVGNNYHEGHSAFAAVLNK